MSDNINYDVEPWRYDDTVEHVMVVMDAIAKFRFSVFRCRNLRRFMGNERHGWVHFVLNALVLNGYVEYYKRIGQHGFQYRRLFSLEDIPIVIREVCC